MSDYELQLSRISNDVQLNPNYEIIQSSGVTNYLQRIRPAWQAKRLVERTINILPSDPSSACQRIFNASIHDLREKVVIAGVDIAQATAKLYGLPTIMSSEDIIDKYDTSRLITLAHRMGLLTRPEYRKIMRVYDIRKDLEHEDDEYEAGVEDVVYVFKTCVDTILANDPTHIIKISDINEIIQAPSPVTIESAVIEDYKNAPTPRQFEIFQMLISISLNDEKPDIVRQNSFNALAALQNVTDRKVILDAATKFNDERLNRRSPLLKEMRVASISGIAPYLRKAYIKDFFEDIYDSMKKVSYHWTSNDEHGELLRNLKEAGGLSYVTEEVKGKITEWLIMCYIGEPGGYGFYGSSRKVFYSNVGSYLSFELLEADKSMTLDYLNKIVNKSNSIKQAITDKYVARRLDKIKDIFSTT